MTIKFGTFNIGSGFSDYNMNLNHEPGNKKQILDQIHQAAISKFGGNFNDSDRKDRDQLGNYISEGQTNHMSTVENSTAQKITDLSEQFDVIALQEVGSLDRPFIKALEEAGYEVLNTSNNEENKTAATHSENDPFVSTAIAYKKNKFSNVKNLSTKINYSSPQPAYYGQEIAAFKANLINSATTVAFASLHSWGFMLHPEGHTIPTDEEIERKQLADEYVDFSMGVLKDSNADYKFFGGDMNNNPHNYSKTFETIEENGYSVLNPNKATNINTGELLYPLRKLDFVFVQKEPKENLIKKICSLFKNIFFNVKKITTSELQVLGEFSKEHCSDHLLAGTVIKLESKSLFHRLFRAA